MDKKYQILDLYFTKKYKQCEISEKLGVSTSSVNRIVMADSRYLEEKTTRKKENKIKHRQKTIRYMNKKRKSGIDSEYEALRRQHIEASKEISGGIKNISNRAFRDWNTSAYKYNYKSKSYVLKKGITVGADVPKKIKW